MRLAVLDRLGTSGDIHFNLETAHSATNKAAKAGADIILFSECFLTGLDLDETESHDLALHEESQTWKTVADFAAENDVCLAIGALTNKGGELFNSLRLYLPSGEFAHYDKSHIPPIGADKWVSPGNDNLARPAQTDVGRIGLLVCYDIRFPEAARSLALGGAQLLLFPAAYPAGAEEVPRHFPTVRAMENGVFVAMAAGGGVDRSLELSSGSQIVSPLGEQIGERLPDSDLILADLDLDAAGLDAFKPVYENYRLSLSADRRPDLYWHEGSSAR
ncbi:carbon-nitrogen hydrolase family protein [Brevibacterium aurantiacum]|uniref:carbon-nitrogen hydrolase family protein n=1 Tax=Brevibacterium aurantiacum TaxID=273384 RepID=UPI0018679948|nr:carbon-nitrogen hydrolase family protein [Brevibacterium aurantiacum]